MSDSHNIESNIMFQNIWYDKDYIILQQEKQEDATTNNLNHCSSASYATDLSQSSISNLKKNFKSAKSKEGGYNSLKNLVVTLRSWVDFKKGIFPESVRTVWKYFKQSKKVNKNFFLKIYGKITEDPQKFNEIQLQIPILLQSTLQQYQRIQQVIQDETLKQLKQANLEYILKYRRVKNKDQFKEYFYNFVRSLQKAEVFRGN